MVPWGLCIIQDIKKYLRFDPVFHSWILTLLDHSNPWCISCQKAGWSREGAEFKSGWAAPARGGKSSAERAVRRGGEEPSKYTRYAGKCEGSDRSNFAEDQSFGVGERCCRWSKMDFILMHIYKKRHLGYLMPVFQKKMLEIIVSWIPFFFVCNSDSKTPPLPFILFPTEKGLSDAKKAADVALAQRREAVEDKENIERKMKALIQR